MNQNKEVKQDFFKDAVDLHNKGNFKRALVMYKKAMDVHGVDKKTMVLLGNAYYMTKNFKEAKKAYNKALSMDPNYSKAHFNLGIILEETKQYKEAIKSYKRAIELEGDFAEAHANLGDIYREMKDINNSILSYKKALEINSEIESAIEGLKYFPDYWIEKVTKRKSIKESDDLVREGISLEKKVLTTEARKKYEEALRVFPESTSGLFLLKLSTVPEKEPILSKNEMRFLKLDIAVIRDSISPEVREFLGKKLAGIDFDSTILESFFSRLKEVANEKSEIDLLKVSRLILIEEPERDLSQAIKLELKGELKAAENKYESLLKKAPYLLHGQYLYGFFQELNENESDALLRYKQTAQYHLDYLDDNIRADIVKFFSNRQGYGYLKKIDLVSLLNEFLEKTRKEGSISLKRFIKYRLSLVAEDKIKYGFEKEESGEASEAINAYEDAVSIDPSNPLSHYVLGLAYESRGLEKEAMAAYENTEGADFRGIETSEDISKIMEQYLSKTTKDGHRVGTILGRYFEIIAEDPEQMLELLGFIEDLKIESISKIIKSYISSDLILGREGKVVRDQKDFGGIAGEGEGASSAEEGVKGIGGRVVRDHLDFGKDLDQEKKKIKKSRSMSKISFELLWKYKTQRSIRCGASTSEGGLILAGSENGIVYFIDQDANSPWRYDTGANVIDIDLSPDGKYGLYCNSNNIVELLDCELNGKSLWKKEMQKIEVNSVAISSNAETIALSTNNFEILIYNQKGNQKKSYKMDEIIRKLDITDDGKIIIAASERRLFLFTDAKTQKKLKALSPKGRIQSISISKKGDLITVGTREGIVYLLDGKGRVLCENDFLNPVYGVSVSSEGRVIAGGMNGFLVLYSREGEQIWKYQTGENIWDVDISENGELIISGCGLVFGNVYLFSLK
jgi:tetratricopeptide (TPR) repeat protein/outer membrane protein assembly factor BamB